MTSGRLQEATRRADELIGLAERLDVDDLVIEVIQHITALLVTN